VDEKPPYNPRHTYYKVGPMQDVPLEHLIATQPDVNADYMGELMGGAQRKDENPPKVVKVGDKYYLENGHHAAALAHAKGEKALKAQVFEYDPATGQTKPASGATKDFPKAKPVPGEEKVPPAPAEHPTGKMDYEPIPEDVSDEEYDRLFEEKNKAVQAGLAKMAEKQKERAAKKAAPQESAPVAQETPPPPPAQAPTAEPAKTQPPEAPKADHLALARQYERGGVIDQEDAEKLRTTYAGLSDMDRTRFAEAFGVENAARSLPEVRDELVERKVKEMAHRGEHGPEVKRNTKNPLFGERGVGESKGLFDAEPEETPTGESNATEEIKHERGAGVEHSGNDRQRPQAEGSGSGSLPRAGGGAGERGQDGAQAKEEGRVEGQGRGLPQVDPEDLGRRLRAAHSDRMSDNPTTGRKGDEEYHRLQEQIDKLPPDQKAKAMAASEPEKPAPEPTGLRVRKANEYRHSNGTVTKTHYLSDDRHTVTEHGGKFVLHENAGGNLSHKGEYASIQEAVGAAGKPPPTSLPMPSVAHKTTEPPKSDLADRLKAHIANLKGEPEEHTSGVPLLKELDGLSQAEVYALLLSAGIEGARPTDSKANLILRLHRRMTAQARSQERNSV
jgi:hypothetical protein